MPRMMTAVRPFEFVITPKVTYINFENNQPRRIYTDGRGFPKDEEPTWQEHEMAWYLTIAPLASRIELRRSHTQIPGLGHFRPWHRGDGSLPLDSFRAGRMPATEGVGQKPKRIEGAELRCS